MSARIYTDDQKAAIDVSLRHLDACIVAGPGSAKTPVLIEHFRGLADDGADNRSHRMSARVYTDDQKAAIDVSLRHLDACIVAGPGSAKTPVLIEHFRGLADDGAESSGATA